MPQFSSDHTPAALAPSPIPRIRWRDTLRVRVLLLLAAALVLFLALLLLPLRQIFLSSFSDLERQNMTTDLTRALNQINNDRDLQQKMIVEYAAWDDTYNFAEQPDQAYIDDNYSDESFANRRSNLTLVLNSKRQLVFGRNVDLNTTEQAPLPLGVEQLYAAGSPLLRFADLNQSNTDIVRLGDQVLLVSAHAILTSQYAGPSHGTLIFGRTFDPGTLEKYSEVTQLPIQILAPDDPQLLAELPAPPGGAFSQQSIYIIPLSSSTIAGYAALRGLDGQANAVLRVAKERTIYQREQVGLLLIALVVGVCGVLLALVLMLLLDRVIIARLALLNSNLATIGSSGDRAGRVSVHGHDELAQLATTINVSLAALEQAETERQSASAQAQQMNQRFIATVSHELRTPLTPIQGYLDLLLLGAAGPLSEDQEQIIGVVKSSADRMSALVEDVLMVSSLNSRGILLHLAPTPLDQMLAEAIEIFKVTSSQRQIALSVEIAPDLPPVLADKRRLHQVIWNLLSNAVKYTEAGGRIWVRARLHDELLAEIEVRDTGVGMSPEQLERLFTPFYRAENSLSIQAGGTGLGLVIAHELVELHGGTIHVASTLHVGSTFTFTLPLAQQALVSAVEPAHTIAE